MAARRSTAVSKPRLVVVIGHNAQVMPIVGLFVGAKVAVRVYAAAKRVEEQLAVYPGVQVLSIDEEYTTAPPDLPEAPYFICLDSAQRAERVRIWLPDTLAVFHMGPEHRGRNAAAGFLSCAQPMAQHRRQLLRRLATLRKLDRLRDMARNAVQPLILMYGDPDPDAIASALALALIWQGNGSNQALIRYTGEVRRYQNKLLISYLKEPIERLRESERESADLVAIVDAQPGFWRNNPPQAQVIIDHHPRREDTSAPFVELRENYGSTATILTEYLSEGNFPIRRRLATALLYGLMTDTGNLQRNTNSPDIQAYDRLHAKADQHFLARLVRSQVPINLLDHLAWGISHRVVYRDLLLIHFGAIATPDILVQSADHMLLTCGINWVVCAGVVDEKLIIVFRGDGHRQDVGARAKAAFIKIGSAGGHRTMGRAEVPLNGESVDTSIEILITNLFRRMSEERRQRFIQILRNHLHGQGPCSPETMP